MQKLSNLSWVGFSEEGLLCTMNDNGVVSALNMKIEQWIPILDLKSIYTETYSNFNFWVAGLMENELFVLELPSHAEQPSIKRTKTIYKRIPLQFPLLDMEAKQNAPGNEKGASVEGKVTLEE